MENNEIYLFILWHNALTKKEEILNNIRSNFTIRNIFRIEWSDNLYEKSIQRFYGVNLVDSKAKIEECGNGHFYAIIVEDDNPVFEYRETSKGRKLVNANIFDKKSEYRKLTGDGYKIHATNTKKEVDHDLTLLFGLNSNDFQSKYDKSSEEIVYNKDIYGSSGWNCVNEVFYVLNNCCNYAILRNFEGLPNDLFVEGHNDVDIICDSSNDVSLAVNAYKIHNEEFRSQYLVSINNYDVYLDLRYIGDNYYFDSLEKRILETRVYNKNGFYTPNVEYYFYSLMYHGLIQKPSISVDYIDRLRTMNPLLIKDEMLTSEMCLILKKWLNKNDFLVTKPHDKSVYFNISNAQLISEKVFVDDVLYLQQNYDKLKNENEYLKKKIDQIENSTIWRTTKPLRKLLDFFK